MRGLVLILATAALVLQDGFAASLAPAKLQDINHLKKHVKSRTKFSEHGRIKITRKPAQRMTHTAGKVLELVCNAVAAPAPSVQWFKNDVPISQYDQESNELQHFSEFSSGYLMSSLLITRPSENEEDVYTCLITAGKKSAMAHSIVTTKKSSQDLSERVKLMPTTPHITIYIDFLMEIQGSKVRLPCRAVGHPRPQIQWIYNHAELITENNDNLKVLKSGDLIINDLRWENLGDYTCQASNEFGSDNKTTFIYPLKAG